MTNTNDSGIPNSCPPADPPAEGARCDHDRYDHCRCPAPFPNGSRDEGDTIGLAAYMEWRDSLPSYLPDAEPWMWESWKACHALRYARGGK